MTNDGPIDSNKKTICVMAAVVLALVVVRFGCNRLSFADKKISALPSPETAGGAKALPAFVVRCLEAQTITKTMRVTAFCADSCCCWPFADGFTASGHRIKPGDKFCAADKSIPFGTMIWIPGYSELPVPVADRGGTIRGDRLDVYFDSHARARAWGVRILDCKLYIGNCDDGS